MNANEITRAIPAGDSWNAGWLFFAGPKRQGLVCGIRCWGRNACYFL